MIYENNKNLLEILGVTGEYATDFEVRKAILTALGGDASKCTSIYDTDLKILQIYEEGGGGTGGNCTELEQLVTTLQDEITALEADITIKEAQIVAKDAEIATVTSISISENGIYTPPTGVLGYNTIDVNVAGGGGSDVLDLSGKTDFSSMFSKCQNLIEAPKMITSDGTNFSFMFNGCSALINIPQFNTSKGTNFMSTFKECINLTTIPQLDTSNGTNFSNMFDSCKNLTTISHLDVSKGNSFYKIFFNCSNLTTISQIDVSNGTDFGYMFDGCRNLQNITFIGSINKSISFLNSSQLNKESIESILSACANTTNSNSKTLKFQSGTTITDTEGTITNLIATCNSNGWTISGLTLQ